MKYWKYALIFLTAIALQAQNERDGIASAKKGTTTDVNLVVDPAVGASAQRAVQVLGSNVKKGNLAFALEKMYPRYRKRLEVRFGAAKLREQVTDLGKKLNQNGIVIERFVAERPTGYFKVWLQITDEGKSKIAAGGDLGPNDTFYNWLVIVPTMQEWKFLDKDGGKPRYLKRTGFQVAIAKVTTPGQEDWTFVDGDSASAPEIRALFASLPYDLLVPETGNSEIKK